jgi:formiminotetrahydrofolate cyclodeaminase
MSDSIWKSTLEEFRNRLAGRSPVPAGVSLAAVSASLGLSLLMKVLEITRRRRDFQGDSKKIEVLLALARDESGKLVRFADDDIVAFAEYMARRGSPEEAAALRTAIEVPLGAAHASAVGLRLCEQAASMTPASTAPDLGTAALLLAGAVRGMLLSVESNAAHVTDCQFREEIEHEIEILRELAKNHQRW